jgi:phage-related minor tail protein
MSMYFLDETDDWPEYRTIREEIQRLDEQHVEVRKELQEVEAGLKSDPANEDLKVKVDVLTKKLKEVEKKLDDSLSMYR